MQKKYSFNKILQEYNEKHRHNYKLPPDAFNVIIAHTVGTDSFVVTYTDEAGICRDKEPLHDFIHFHISSSITWKDIENIILSKKEENLNLKIKVWPPSKIRYAYLRSNYFAKDVGNLGKSCMRVKEMQKALNFYVKNNIRIVVVVDNNNKIHARALLWDNVKSTKLKTPFTYLDRVYAGTDTLCSLFYDLAKENKWKQYRSTAVNQMDKNYYKEDIIVAGMCHLPFMDTFRYLYPKDNLLTASTELSINKNSDSYTTLNEHTNYGYYPNLDLDRIREAFTGHYISKKDAVFVKRYEGNQDGYVLKENIVNINGDYYSSQDKKNITLTTLDGHTLKEDVVNEVITNDTMIKSTAIHSVKYDGYIHESNAVEAFQCGVGGRLFHKKDTDIICFDNKWYHTSQCFINYDRKKRNIALSKQKFHFWIEDEVFVPYPDDFVVRKDGLIPKERTIIAYDLTYSPVLGNIEYQEVYCTNMQFLIPLITGELIVDSSDNRKYMKKFNNKYHIKREFRLQDKKQLQFGFMNKEK